MAKNFLTIPQWHTKHKTHFVDGFTDKLRWRALRQRADARQRAVERHKRRDAWVVVPLNVATNEKVALREPDGVEAICEALVL